MCSNAVRTLTGIEIRELVACFDVLFSILFGQFGVLASRPANLHAVHENPQISEGDNDNHQTVSGGQEGCRSQARATFLEERSQTNLGQNGLFDQGRNECQSKGIGESRGHGKL